MGAAYGPAGGEVPTLDERTGRLVYGDALLNNPPPAGSASRAPAKEARSSRNPRGTLPMSHDDGARLTERAQSGRPASSPPPRRSRS